MRRSLLLVTAVAALALGVTIPGAAVASPSASIEQVRNGQATATTTPIPTWNTGNAGASNSHYLESHSIAYRTVMDQLPTDGTVIELIIGYDVKRSGSYAIDYLTHFQRLLPHVLFAHRDPEVFDPLSGITGVGPTITTAAIPVPTRSIVVDPDGTGPDPAAPQPTTSASALPASERVMTLYGGTLIDVSYVTEADVNLTTKSSESQVRVRFTADSPTAVLAWGGHIACRWDWGFNADGTPRSAGGISGSSYHMRLVTWSLGSLGNQDRSMSTDAVYPVPKCAISNLGPFCAGSTNTHTAPAGMESYQWSLVDNSSGAFIVGSDTSLSVVVNAGPTGGSYTLSLTTGASGFSRACTAIVTVYAPPTAGAGADQVVCASSPQVQLAGTVTGGAGTWSGGTGTFNPSATALDAIYTPSAAEITAGGVTLTLSCRPLDGPCPAATDQVAIAIQRAATANAGADQVVCAMSPLVQLAGSVGGSAAGGTWSGGAGTFTPSAAALNATYLPTPDEITAGSVTLTLTTSDPDGPCAAVSDQMVVTINPAATVDAGPDFAVCSSSPRAQLAGAIGGAATSATWSGGAGSYSPSASTLNAVYTPTAAEIAAGGVTLKLTTSDPAGPCPAVNDQVRISILPAATSNAGADQTVCATSPQVTLAGVIGGGATSGTWSGGGGTFSPDAATLNAVYTPSAAEIAAGTVTLTLTTDDPAGPCAAVSDQMVVTINRAATVDAGSDLTVCSSAPRAQLAGVIGGAAASATWSGGAGSYSPNASTLNALYTPTAAEIAAGGVTLTLATNDPAGPCPLVSDQVRITILPAATANAGADQTVCATSPQVTLAGTIGGGATTGTWSGGAGTFSPDASTLNAVYMPSAAEIAAGTVTLTLSTDDPAGPCPVISDQMVVTINRAATVDAGPDQTLCSSSPRAQLAGGIGGAAATASWSGGAGSYSPGATTLNAIYTPTAAEIAAGGVTLTLTTSDPTGPCPAVSDQVRITILPAATANAGADQTVCATSPQVTLAGVIGGGATDGTWSGGSGTLSPDASTLNAVYTPSPAEIAAGGVTLTLTTNDPAGPCPAVSDAMHITINPAAVANAGPDQTVCASSPRVQLAGQVTGGATNGTWTGGAGTFSPNASTLNAAYTPTAGEIAAGSVTLTLTSADPAGPCPPVSDPMKITIDPITVVNAGPDQVVCASSPRVQLQGFVGGTVSTGTWSGGTGTFSPGNTTLNATYTPSAAEVAAGIVTLTLTSALSSPCPPASDQMNIVINVAATVNAGPDQIVCAAAPQVQLAGSIGGSATGATWTGGAGTFTPGNTALNATYLPTAGEIAAGSVTLTLTTNDPAGPCPPVSDQMQITIDSPAVTVPDVVVCSGIRPVTLCANPHGIAPFTYRWNTGATTPCISVSDTGSYTVTMTDARGCQATGSGAFRFRDCIGELMHTSTTCATWEAGTGLDFSSADVHVVFKDNIITSISPGVFFYFSKVWAPRSDFTIQLVQTRDNANYPFCDIQQGQVVLYDADCNNIGGGTETSPGQGSIDVHGVQPGHMLVISVKYSLKMLVGAYMDSTMGVHYDFKTVVDGVVVDQDPDGLQIGTRQTPGGGGGTGGGSSTDDGIILHKRGGAASALPSDPEGLAAYRPTPNPFSDGMHMAYAVGGSGARVNIGVYDLAGRLVRTLDDAYESPGAHVVTWDGRDAQGARAHKGVYFVHAQVGAEARFVRVTFLK
jgi:flagellar hook capping protein FlgD